MIILVFALLNCCKLRKLRIFRFLIIAVLQLIATASSIGGCPPSDFSRDFHRHRSDSKSSTCNLYYAPRKNNDSMAGLYGILMVSDCNYLLYFCVHVARTLIGRRFARIFGPPFILYFARPFGQRKDIPPKPWLRMFFCSSLSK